ncbi:MAG: AAA family ATPase [Magnetococcus sp. YQC-5]
MNQLLNKKIPDINEIQNLTGWRDNKILLDQVLKDEEHSKKFMVLLHAMLVEGKKGTNVSGSLGDLLRWLIEVSCPYNLTKAFPSLFLFLWNPENHFFIKPQKLDQFLQYIGEQPLGTGKYLTTEEYARVLGIMNEIRTGIIDWHPRDMIDIHSFFWVVYSSWDMDVKKAIDDQSPMQKIMPNHFETSIYMEEVEATSKPPINLIYYGPPGTGKTYTLQKKLREEYTSMKTGEKYYDFVTFHQSYGYEEFVEGLRPVLATETISGQVRYEIRSGTFRKLCERARNRPNQKFAMVIDEINRGNISKIFGELITLIELDKRDPMNHESTPVEVRLPYSGELFSVPANVDIIGTMNTADRSLALIDTALRRRFEFVPLMPDSRDSDDAPLKGVSVTVGDQVINIPQLLGQMNRRIEALYDRDHTIGHAYFMSLIHVPDGLERFNELARIFRNRIMPLLEEYFFDDWQKISLVLADNQKASHGDPFACFVTANPDQEGDLSTLFGNDHELDVFATKKRFSLQDEAFDNPNAYIGIYRDN